MNYMFIAIDIGGTNTRLGASRDGRRFFAIEKFKTPKRFEDGIKTISRTVLNFTKGQSLKHRIAVAVPGPVDATHKKFLRLPNLPGWRNKPIASTLTKTLHAKVFLINDADAAGLGEALHGAGSGYERVGYLTISTGIGGTLIIAGKYIVSAEPGHHIMVANGRQCGCGRRGCFEAYASGTGFFKTYGIRPEDCQDQTTWNAYAQTLGQGIINAIRFWSPDILVIGGGLSQVGLRLFRPLVTFVKNHFKTFKPPPLVPAKLGDNAGLYGCLALL